MKVRTISESSTEPILVAEAGENLRAPHNNDVPRVYVEESLIERLIKEARQLCEQELEVSLVEKTLEASFDSFSCEIKLPYGPVRSIDSVTYVNSDGDDVVMTDDEYRFSEFDSVIRRPYDVSWPSARYDTDSIRVRYTVGYPSTESPVDEVPAPIRRAMHLYIAHYYVHREAVNVSNLTDLPLGVKHLLGTYRRGLGV